MKENTIIRLLEIRDDMARLIQRALENDRPIEVLSSLEYRSLKMEFNSILADRINPHIAVPYSPGQ